MNKKRDPYWITGFTDGNGSFSLSISKDVNKLSNKKVAYYKWDFSFEFSSRGDDRETMESIKDYFGCGRTGTYFYKGHNHEHGVTVYSEKNYTKLYEIIIPHFEKYPLQTRKSLQFDLWSEAVGIAYAVRQRKPKDIFSPKLEFSSNENERMTEIFWSLKKLHNTENKKPKNHPSLAGTTQILEI